MLYGSVPQWKQAFRAIHDSDAAGDASFDVAWRASEGSAFYYGEILEAYYNYLVAGRPKLTHEQYSNCVYNAAALARDVEYVLEHVDQYKSHRLT